MEVSVEPDLSDNLSRYFAAQNDHDAEGMTNCFAPEAVVRDEGRIYVGRDAIREWKLDTIAKYDITVEPLGSKPGADGTTVVARVDGNFPGSPADLTYDFNVDANGLIQTLEIH
jgi:hypothetical protein